MTVREQGWIQGGMGGCMPPHRVHLLRFKEACWPASRPFDIYNTHTPPENPGAIPVRELSKKSILQTVSAKSSLLWPESGYVYCFRFGSCVCPSFHLCASALMPKPFDKLLSNFNTLPVVAISSDKFDIGNDPTRNLDHTDKKLKIHFSLFLAKLLNILIS